MQSYPRKTLSPIERKMQTYNTINPQSKNYPVLDYPCSFAAFVLDYHCLLFDFSLVTVLLEGAKLSLSNFGNL